MARLVFQVSPQQCGARLPARAPRPRGEGGPSAVASLAGWGGERVVRAERGKFAGSPQALRGGGAPAAWGCPLFTSPAGAGLAASLGTPSGRGPASLPGRLSLRRASSSCAHLLHASPLHLTPPHAREAPSSCPYFPRCNLSCLLMNVWGFFPFNGREGTWHSRRGLCLQSLAQTRFSFLSGPHFSFFAFPSPCPGPRLPGRRPRCS